MLKYFLKILLERWQKLFAYNVASINQTLQLIDKEAYCKAAKHLKAAKHVYCFGQGASGIMAQELWGRFITVSSNFSYITDPHLQTIMTANCDKDDVIVLSHIQEQLKMDLDFCLRQK